MTKLGGIQMRANQNIPPYPYSLKFSTNILDSNDDEMGHILDTCTAFDLERGELKRVILRFKSAVVLSNTEFLGKILDRLVIIQNPNNVVIAAGDAPIDSIFVKQVLMISHEFSVLAPLELIDIIKKIQGS